VNIGSERPDEPDIQQIIKELAATWADPFWVAEFMAVEQDAPRARLQRLGGKVIKLDGWRVGRRREK
jgi:hypothetical protein